MLVSWNWLKEYVRLQMSAEELVARLMMAGLNHEATIERGGDLVIDLEVTSNRPDCLSHLGVAREIALLFDQPLETPAAAPVEGAAPVSSLTRVQLECPDLCPRYTARVIRGIKVGPSPAWLQRRLAAVGIATINNVVDVTNYVLLECGQPLHAFDFDKLLERRIVVRRGRPGESMVAINQRRYELTSETCVIADGQRAVAIGGVMGGFDSEVGQPTTDLLIESAQFDPLSIRITSRTLGLSSESSYRFERGIDPEGVEWASRRACELILELAGGELAEGVIYAGTRPPPRASVALRFARLKQILGSEIAPEEAVRILQKLGLRVETREAQRVLVKPPTWRSDLTREIDLIEEVGRIHGYEAVPERSDIAARSFTPTQRQRIVARLRELLCGAGIHEAVTFSLLDEATVAGFSPWSAQPPLCVEHPSRRRERALRKSLIPSLLAVRRRNEAHGNEDADFFELARIYLPGQAGQLPEEPMMIGIVSGRDFAGIKGVCEMLAVVISRRECVQAASCLLGEAARGEGSTPSANPGSTLFDPGQGAELRIDGRLWGYVGRINDALVESFKLMQPCTVAELRIDVLETVVSGIPRYRPLIAFPATERELSLVMDESITWQGLQEVVRGHAGPCLEEIRFLDLYHGDQVPAGKKSVHFRLRYRAPDRTLTHDEVESFQQAVISTCEKQLGVKLRG